MAELSFNYSLPPTGGEIQTIISSSSLEPYAEVGEQEQEERREAGW